MPSTLVQSMSARALEVCLCEYAGWLPPATTEEQRRRRRLIYDLFPTQPGERPVLCDDTTTDDAEDLFNAVCVAAGTDLSWNYSLSIRTNLELVWDAAVEALNVWDL
jgi:hypothetical protein